MILRIFTIWDIKAENFSNPFFMSTAGEAIRAFKDLVNDGNTTVGRHPGDYRLMCIGTWDNSTGTITTEQQDSFGFGSDYKDIGPTQIPLGLVKTP